MHAWEAVQKSVDYIEEHLQENIRAEALYHGPRNDLPPDYAPKQVIALLNARKNQIFCVRGNCDTEVDQMVLEFPVLADYAVLTAGSRLLYATHGHVYNTAHLPPLQPGDILLHETRLKINRSSRKSR